MNLEQEAAIRARHARAGNTDSKDWTYAAFAMAHDDRAALLAALDEMRARINALDAILIERNREFLSTFKAAEAAQERERALREALAELLDACDAHNKANGKQMIDKHAEANARAALARAGGVS